MSGAEWALQVAVRDALAGDADVKSWIGDPARIYDEPPSDPTFPYVTFGRSQSRPGDSDAAPTTEHLLHLHVWSLYGGRREAKETAAALRAVLDGAALSLDGRHLVSLRVTYVDIFRLGDGRTTRGVIRIRAVTEPQTT